MPRLRHVWALGACALAPLLLGCNGSQPSAPVSAASSASASSASDASPAPAAGSVSEPAPPASQTGGFDGAAAYDFTSKLVAFGPRPPDSDAIRRTQDYIRSQLKSFGCLVEEDHFNAQTPIGTLAMDNIVAQVPGTGQGIILLLTHYDTLRLDGFVGANDAGSSSGVMLELAKLLCARPKQANAVWITFLDGEEAQVVQNGVAQWTATDSVYGSRELAARLAVSGNLKKVKAVILADMIGQKNLEIPRESTSTPWLTDLVWRTASRLGYKDVFLSRSESVSDDHGPFLSRGVPATDIIEYTGYVDLGYWHTTLDTMDKISPRSLAIVGQVILESVNELQKRP